MVIKDLARRIVFSLIIGLAAGAVGPAFWGILREFTCGDVGLLAILRLAIGGAAIGALIAGLLVTVREIFSKTPARVNPVVLGMIAVIAFLPGATFGILIYVADC